MTIITAGVTDGPLVARQEIRIMMQDQELFTLYILALDRFQSIDQSDLLSYFQIAGIHGRPYVAYDGATGVGNFGGYCTHSSILFPPWHRPYLALFEQALAKHVNDIANEYSPADQAKYQAAAQRFRVPYWDWALNADLPDVIARQHELSLNTPSGFKTIANPLYTYTFHPLYQDFGDGLNNEKTWESWRSTYRYPTRPDAEAVSNDEAMERTLDNNRKTIRDRTWNLLTQAPTYQSFSNDSFLGANSDPKSYESLESIHGQIHGMTGSSGHMGVVDFAAFDPVFWLHHANVDRLFAMWQALNPDSYVVPQVNDAGTFSTPQGTVETLDSPLAPFWKSEGVFWTAQDARDTRTFNYTYPELVNWANLDPDTKGDRIRSDINAMYGKSAAWGAINSGIFNVNPSVPIAQPAVSAFRASSHAVPAVAATSKVAERKVAPGIGAAAQQAWPAPLSSDAIRKAMDEGAQAARDRQAVGASHSSGVSKKVAGPASLVANVANTAENAASSAAPHVPVVVPVATPRQAFAIAQSTVAAPDQRAEPASTKPQGSEMVDTEMAAGDKKEYTEWIANINVEKYAARTSFFVYIFLGDFNPDPTKWSEDPNLVGVHYVLANNMTYTGCERCRDQAEEHKLVTGTIPLTGALGDHLGQEQLGSLERDKVVPYLQKELHWRIKTHDGKVIERADMPSLKVSVARIPVSLPESINEFPTWGTGTREAVVTAGRPAGANEDDD